MFDGMREGIRKSRPRMPGRQKKADIKEYVLLGFLATQIGIVVGLAAIGFRYLLSITHNMFFLGQPSLEYDSYSYMTT
ncbi:MAG: hypothetical protein KAX31_04645, partial [Thermoplasmata archaeon]|nr:hypothetical protein [Thermoplasmata archaeon]